MGLNLTGILAGSDGALYITNFMQAPYPAEGAKIFRLTTDGQVTPVATGLSLATGLVVGPDGTFYVSEFAKPPSVMPPSVAPPGRLVRLNRRGTVEDNASGW